MAEASEVKATSGATSSSSEVGPGEASSNSGHPERETDKDAQEMVIDSLRTQVQDLFSQVSQLNNKLVRSYDRVSDLEDELHMASSNFRSSSLKISQLELERAQHLSALNTGLLVEKANVTAELSRLMERATEEAAQRGQAESARAAIEKDLDDLSATLFGQANAMVAEARFARHLSERKVEDSERALESAEEAVSIMQQQVQALQQEKEDAERKAQETEALMGKGKWIARRDSQNLMKSMRLLNSHAPYQEFLFFVGHLRSLHVTVQHPPAMPTLLQLPFLARLSSEDSEPTVRLDLAPSLNWLSRRSVLTAIHTGQLTIEPIPSTTLLSESASNGSSSTVAGLHSSNDNVSCALCGIPVFPPKPSLSKPLRPPTHPLSSMAYPQSQGSGSWSSSLFKKPSGVSHPPTPPGSPSHSPHQPYPQQVYIFRLASPPTSSITSIPIPSLSKTPMSSLSKTPVSSLYKSSSPSNSSTMLVTQQQIPSTSPTTTIYPLCTNGWCLSRLRSTCTLWAFVRTGIVEHVWEEELAAVEPPPVVPIPSSASSAEKPPIPPRKRGLWGIASAFSEKAASWGEADKKTSVQEEKKLPLPPPPTSHLDAHSLPSSPPVHPSVASQTAKTASDDTVHAVPPPLPKRSVVRARQATVNPKPSAGGSSAGETRKPADEATAKAESESSPEASSSLPSQIKTAMPPPPLPQRARTPASTPLPESRPSTPPVHLNQSNGAGSPAPPPLPRRAAARASRLPATDSGSRPNSPSVASATAIIAEDTATSSISENAVAKESTTAAAPADTAKPLSPSEATSETSGSSKEEGSKVADEILPPITVSKSSTPSTVEDTPSNPENKDEIPSRPTLNSQVSEDEFVDAPETAVEEGLNKNESEAVATEGKETVEEPSITANGNAETEEKEVVVVEEEDEKKKDVADDDDKTIGEEKEVVVDGVNDEEVIGAAVAAIDDKLDEEQEEPSVNGDVKATEDEVPSLNDDMKAAENEVKVNGTGKPVTDEPEDMEGYVGHTTWEERTWHELVKLREEMFWARIGGLRS